MAYEELGWVKLKLLYLFFSCKTIDLAEYAAFKFRIGGSLGQPVVLHVSHRAVVAELTKTSIVQIFGLLKGVVVDTKLERI